MRANALHVSKQTLLVGAFIAICLFLGASYALQGSFQFDADIARDFLLLDELQTKKIITIGPRASGIPGVFHGPLWIYLNFPVYSISQGNPLGVAWWWVVLAGIFLASTYQLARKTIADAGGMIVTLLLAGMLIPWLSQMLNPVGALMTFPLLLFAVHHYQQTKQLKYWLVILFSLGVMIQFQMAAGVPIAVLVIGWFVYWMYQHKLLHHLCWLPVGLIPLASFFMFDLRHNFGQTRAALSFLADKSTAPEVSYLARLWQRVVLMSSQGIYIFTHKSLQLLNVGIFVALCLQAAGKLFKIPKKEQQFFVFLFYLYVGFYAISVFFNGFLLRHYWWPMVPVVFYMVALMLKNAPKKLGWGTLIILLLYQLASGVEFAMSTAQKVGQIEDDWQFQKQLTQQVFTGPETQFGYFIFTPDVYAYETKAAMVYQIARHPQKLVIRYQKQPVTYLIIAPPPPERPDVNATIWKQQRVRLDATPTQVVEMPAGYSIERYELSTDELSVPPDATIDDWLHFR